MSEALSALVALALMASGVLAASRAASRLEVVGSSIHALWINEHATRLCAEREALLRNLHDAAEVIALAAASKDRTVRATEQLAVRFQEELSDIWPAPVGVALMVDYCRAPSVYEGSGHEENGPEAWIRREIGASGGFPSAWPRWTVRWGQAMDSTRSD